MNTLNTLATLLSEKVRNGSLEDISLTNSNSLRTFAKCLTSAKGSGIDVPASAKGVFDAVTEFSETVKDQAHNRDVLAMFQSISDAFAKKINKSYVELSKIKDTVNRLVGKITAVAKDRIAEDPVLAASESLNTTSTKLNYVRWDLLRNVSEPVLIHDLCHRLGIEEITAGNESYIRDLLISRLPYENDKTKVDLQPIVVTRAKANEMVNAVCAKVGKALGKDIVKACMVHVLSLDEYKCRKAVNSIKRFASGESANLINDMLGMVYSYGTILPHMTRDVLDVSASTQSLVDAKVDAMKSFIDITSYICSQYRNTIWKDAVVVPGMKVNTDNWGEFCKQDRKMIKSNPTLAIIQYKNKIYGDDPIPVYGIKGETIANVCDEIAKEAYAEASSNTLACNQKKKEIFRDAFISVSGQWLRSQKNYSVEYLYDNEPEQYAASIYDSNRDDAVENMLYTVILNSCYVDTLTSKLHNRLRDEYRKLALSAESLNERDVINADTKVLADTINEFMVDLLLI